MFDIEMTSEFSDWLRKLGDRTARQKIVVRIARLRGGHFGDAKTVAGRIKELRIDYGPGYRIYFVREGSRLILLLCGGDKASQQRDIRKAAKLDAERTASS